MINILNRKALLVTYNSKLYSKVLDALDNNKIEYTVKLKNTGSVSKRSGALAGYNLRRNQQLVIKVIATILIVCVIAFVLFIDAIAVGIIGLVPN